MSCEKCWLDLWFSLHDFRSCRAVGGTVEHVSAARSEDQRLLGGYHSLLRLRYLGLLHCGHLAVHGRTVGLLAHAASSLVSFHYCSPDYLLILWSPPYKKRWNRVHVRLITNFWSLHISGWSFRASSTKETASVLCLSPLKIYCRPRTTSDHGNKRSCCYGDVYPFVYNVWYM